ncbi:MAG: hypothetical protein R2764_10490 [Bacteroidales bacterium]
MIKKPKVLNKPQVEETNQDYEIDEMITYVSKKSPSNYTYFVLLPIVRTTQS